MSKRRIVLKVISYGFAACLVGLLTAHFWWKYSGSGEWVLERELDGTTVYSMKESGSVYKKFKVISKFNSKLSPIMKVMRDAETCEEVGCYDYSIFGDASKSPQFVHYTFKYAFPWPFSPRQYVVLSEFRQDPVTKAIYTDFKSTPEAIPDDDCCIRVSKMHNIWKFEPGSNGDVKVEFIQDEEPGGFLPYFLFNAENTNTIHLNIPYLQKILNKERFKNAVVDYVAEVQ